MRAERLAIDVGTAIALIALAAACFSVIWPMLAKDSTDPPEGLRGSGLNLRIDHGTGCHWFVGVFSAPTPRLDKTDSQICTGRDGEASLLRGGDVGAKP